MFEADVLGKIILVVHFVDDDWILQKRIIGFRCLDVKHIGQNIDDRITTVLFEWKLENRIIAFTLDNASANNCAIEIIRPFVSGHHDKLLHQICACHIINLIIKSGENTLIDI